MSKLSKFLGVFENKTNKPKNIFFFKKNLTFFIDAMCIMDWVKQGCTGLWSWSCMEDIIDAGDLRMRQ
jgi:hypothetical protein